jgi:hypothetical protein
MFAIIYRPVGAEESKVLKCDTFEEAEVLMTRYAQAANVRVHGASPAVSIDGDLVLTPPVLYSVTEISTAPPTVAEEAAVEVAPEEIVEEEPTA